VVAVTEWGGRRLRSHLHLFVRLLVVIFLVDVLNGNNISSILLGMMKDGIDLATETGLREMSLQEMRVGNIVVIENSSLEVCYLFSFVENCKLICILFSDGYSSADDRGYGPSLPNRDADRGRPPGPYTLPYGRVRPRSPSPVRRAGSGSMDDSRLVMKRPREDFPSGYYPHVPPAGNRDGPGPMRRPPVEYPLPPPPRSASSGPPPSSASWPPPPASGVSNAGGPAGDRDRDYRMGRDGMDFSPPVTGYDRSRTPPAPLGRHSYGRGGGGVGYGRGDPRERGGYGRP
jgi:hypothetical protein